MKNIRRMKQNGRSSDISLKWLIESHGKEWEGWRRLAESWLISQDTSHNRKLEALALFFDTYVTANFPWATDVNKFFEDAGTSYELSTQGFKSTIINKTQRSDNNSLNGILNDIYYFIGWVLETSFSKRNKYGQLELLYKNPFEKSLSKQDYFETVNSPLPYRYICDLRKILCPRTRGYFRNWHWAFENTCAQRDWFEVEENQIDKADEDCVWRSRTKSRKTIYEMWSPVLAVALFIKLHLPLRTYQVRMLDSGEADEMRYFNKNWIKNTKHPFIIKFNNKGVFRRYKDNATGVESTGLYINTNKTADNNKDVFNRGYEIPWQNEDVLYWLEKLRNWQEKYNPIFNPTDCSTLETKHTKHSQSKAYLSKMGHICFLMRDAAANYIKDRSMPITNGSITKLWYNLLLELENKLKKSGDTLENGIPLKLVHDYGDVNTTKVKTEFPLHSLRVSLITSYILDAKLPLPVVSKLLAGHSRLLMTVYYTKLTPAVMKEKMLEADKILEGNFQTGIRTFLKDAEMRQIECKTAFHDGKSITAALVNRNPVGWEKRHHGLCLAGGNTVKSDEVGTLAGCWNGGEVIKYSSSASLRIHAPVPHGAENCVRCRWFITDATYIPALNAHLNFMSYKAYEAASISVKLESDIENLEEQKYEAEIMNKPFIRVHELQALQRRHEKQLAEADEYTKDFIATLDLIHRLIEIEQYREEVDNQIKLIAVGSENDIKIGFTETNSDLLHLSILCEDAEIYPDLLDEVKKTSAIQDRSQILSQIMMRKGFMPVLVSLDINQQLIAANAMMRQMALQANPTNKVDGYHQVANYLDLESYMNNDELFNTGIDALEESAKLSLAAISIKSLSNNTGVFTHGD